MTRTVSFSPFETIDGDRRLGMVLVADHAKRDLPDEYGSLGLPESEFSRHIAYDIGVEAVTRHLARLTGAPAVMAGFSRLLIDPNRGEDDPTLIRQLYDGTIVPGNYPITPEERQRRLGTLLPALSRRRGLDDRLRAPGDGGGALRLFRAFASRLGCREGSGPGTPACCGIPTRARRCR